MDITQNPILTVLIAIIGYFLKKTFEKVEEISRDVSDMRPKLDILWRDKIAPANSPRQLNEKGLQILNTSGIKQIVEEKREYLLGLIREKNPTNPYDADISISSIVFDLPSHCPDIVDRLKQGAFLSGVDTGTVLLAGSLYLRDLIFKDLGFDLGDLDKSGK